MKIRLTSSGRWMNSRRMDRKAAITPDTCGAAWLVPLISRYLATTPVSSTVGFFFVALRARASGIWLDSHEITFSPGATRSGLIRPSPVGPFDEKYDTP